MNDSHPETDWSDPAPRAASITGACILLAAIIAVGGAIVWLV